MTLPPRIAARAYRGRRARRCDAPEWSAQRGCARRPATAPSAGRPCEAVHLLRELKVALGHPAGIVGRKSDFDPVVDIEPFRMVVELFGDEGRTRHEAEGLVEVREGEISADG